MGQVKVVNIERRLPANFNEDDKNLFYHELNLKIAPPFIANRRFFLSNPFTLTYYNRKAFVKKQRLILHKGKLRDVIKFQWKVVFQQVIIFDHWSLNYFHWFTDVLPKLFILSEKYPGAEVMIPNWLYEVTFVKESLAAVPAIKLRIIRNNLLLFAVKALYININTLPGNYNPVLIQPVRNLFFSTVKISSSPSYNGIFIFRSLQQGRGVINFEQLIISLKKWKIQILDFANLKWKQQVEAVMSTSLLIGVHGAGLTNMFALQKGANVFELRREGDNHNNCYFSLASALKLQYWYQLCEVDDKEKSTQSNNFYVDVPAFENILSSILQSNSKEQ